MKQPDAAVEIGHARTEAEVRSAVMLAVFDDRDRSLEGAVERAVRAGIEFEHARIKSILELSAPPGLEKALLSYALHPSTTIEGAKEFITTFPLDPSHSISLRKSFRVVERTEKAQEDAR